MRGNRLHALARSVGLLGYRDVAQLVARTAGGREVAGSSPVIPTMNLYLRDSGTYFTISRIKAIKQT
jgi:hypothetical protein